MSAKLCLLWVFVFLMGVLELPGQNKGVVFKHHPEKQELEVWIDGQHFTNYVYHDALKKPVLYPIKTKSGKVLTRGFPFATQPGERVDHRHHVGHWFNYGDVNGLDFWNNSDDRPAEKKHKYGEVRHQSLLLAEPSGRSRSFIYAAHWVDANGSVLLTENTALTFQAHKGTWIIDRKTTLTAEKQVLFKDNKEGMVAIRVNRALELPTDKPGWYADHEGRPYKEKTVNNSGAKGDYLSSDGTTGSKVWGTRASWMKLFGDIGGEQVEIIIIDHKKNIGYPSYWHARGYGLFAANPLGQKVFSKGKEELNFSLKKGESQTFQYRILVQEGKPLSQKKIEKFKKGFERLPY